MLATSESREATNASTTCLKSAIFELLRCQIDQNPFRGRPVVRGGAVSEVRTGTYNESGAAEESRTLDLNLGKVALYQLSYCRM